MHLLYIESSPRGPRSVSSAVAQAFLQAYRQACPELTVDTLNVWEENLPDFDQEAIGAKYKGISKEPTREASITDGLEEARKLAADF
jgi:FMN-dependent NADH-azoreductase